MLLLEQLCMLLITFQHCLLQGLLLRGDCGLQSLHLDTASCMNACDVDCHVTS